MASPQPGVPLPAPEAPGAAPGDAPAMPGGPGMMGGGMGMMGGGPGMMGPGMMGPDMMGPGMGMMGDRGPRGTMRMGEGPTDPVTAAFEAINRRMHRDMAVAPSGSPDQDFARAMIPHHQGAIEMAKVVLGFGKDPEIRKLAEEVIAAQEQEIAVLRQWLARQPQ